MKENIFDSITNFTQKFKRFSESSGTVRNVQTNKDSLIQSELIERQERFFAAVTGTYRIYKSPFEALGKDSERAKSLDNDEQSLLKAYNLYKKVFDINNEAKEEIGATYISKTEICSPLTQKTNYTDGGQFIYLILWLFFEKKAQDFLPSFVKENGRTSLIFLPFSESLLAQTEREIFNIVKEEFYS